MLHNKIRDIIYLFKSKISTKNQEIIDVISSQYSDYEFEKIFTERLTCSDKSSELSFILTILDIKDKKIIDTVTNIILKLNTEELKVIRHVM